MKVELPAELSSQLRQKAICSENGYSENCPIPNGGLTYEENDDIDEHHVVWRGRNAPDFADSSRR